MKRITQTKEIKTGDNSGIVVSGEEKISYSADFEQDDFEPNDLITFQVASEMIEANAPTGSGLELWDISQAPYVENSYVTHPIDGIEYLFRSKEDGNTDEPTLSSTTEGAWIQTDIYGFITSWSSGVTYSIGNYVTGDSNTNVYKSKINGNIGNNPNGNANPDEWELIGAYIGFYFPGTFNLGDVVIVSAESNRIYISNIADNEEPITDIVTASKWQIIGAPAGGSGGNPTSGTLLDSDPPLVITWNTDLVPDDAEGRTYFEKHGALEFTTVQISMPDPANVGDNTYFPPNARFDEATKNILTIDNQGQKLYYVIGFGADGSSSHAGITLTTVGTSGPATLIGTVLNIPEYTSGGGGGLELGETSTTAYRGDRGKTAYDHSQITSGNPHGTTKTDIGLGNVDNTSDVNKPVSTAQQTAIDAKVENNLTASTTVAPSKTAVNTALSGKEDSLPSGLASEYIRGNKTLAVLDKIAVGLNNVDNTSDASKPVSTATQTALDLKAPIDSPTFTGTVGGVSKSMVGLGNVDNTSDSVKPVSTAQQAALDLKANLASPSLTGTPVSPTAAIGTNTTQIATMAAVYQAVTQLQGINTQTASYTIALADAGKLVQMNVASANNLTIPLNSSVAFPVNTQLVIRQIGAGQTTIVATGGVAIQSSGGKLKLTGQYSGVTLVKVATDTWALMGDIAS